MKKALLSLVLLISCSSAVFSQVSMSPHLSAGVEYGLTTGKLSGLYGSVFGSSLKVEVPVGSPKFSITGTAGFTEYAVRLDYHGPLNIKGIQFIPVELGGRYYFTSIGYFEGDAGVSQNIQKKYFTGASTAFIYAPIVGFSVPTNSHKGTIDMGLRYENRGSNSQMALRLAYRFGPTYPAAEKKRDGK